MIDPRIFLCQPISYKDICQIYPPTVNDIVAKPIIHTYYSLLTYCQDDIDELIKDKQVTGIDKLTPLEFLLLNAYQSKQVENHVREAFKQFIHSDVLISYEHKLIIIGAAKDLQKVTDLTTVKTLNNDNFLDFQNCIRTSMGNEIVLPIDPNEPPLKRRMRLASRRRERAAAKKQSKNGISLTTTLGAICCMNMGLNPLNIGEISYASVNILTTLYQQKEKYHTDIDSLMAGADPKKVKPKYWIREESTMQEMKI